MSSQIMIIINNINNKQLIFVCDKLQYVMRKTIYLFALSLLMFACNTEKKEDKKDKEITTEYNSFGAQMNDLGVLSSADMMTKYAALKAGDSIAVKFSSSINDLCSKKGCWMKLDLGDGKETMVRFKDYGFFMPLDSKGKDVIVEGKAFVKEVSVKDLKHYAEDAGKSKEEIDAITEPKMEFAFEATGVLMKK